MHLPTLATLLLAVSCSAHFIPTYPGWRGNTWTHQFHFPCGGIEGPTENRTRWPTPGGAIAWIPQHAWGLVTINIAVGNGVNESHEVQLNPFPTTMVPAFNQTGGNNTFCIPFVPVPKKVKKDVMHGVNATIQIIQLTPTGAALYNCLDIMFDDDEAMRFGAPEVWDNTCFNGTGMGGLNLGETGEPVTKAASAASGGVRSPMAVVVVVAVVVGLMDWVG